MKSRNLILVRHGQSEWNAKNLFTGWKDPGLTDQGVSEAKNAGKLIKGNGRILVRKSGTESKIRVMGESENKALLYKCVNMITKKIKIN